jgi:segregation and condensation protein B
MMNVAIRRGPQLRRRYDALPGNVLLPLIYRLAPEQSVVHGEGARDKSLAMVEAALFAADEPLSPRKLALAAELTEAADARRYVHRLKELYDADGTAFQIEEIAGGWQLRTRPEFHPWLVRLRQATPTPRLSNAALETLAIIAYKQPLTRADVEKIRGVKVDELLRHLMEKGLLRITGRHDSLGRPVLYGTTKTFLQVFGLNSLKDLPEVEQLRPPG